MSSYLDPTIPQSDPYAPSFQVYEKEINDKPASWLSNFNTLVNQPGFMAAYSSAKSAGDAYHRNLINQVGDIISRDKQFIGLTLAEVDTDNFDKFVAERKDELFQNADSSAQSLNGSAVAPSTIDYLYSDLAKHYGMDATTAYQEALANTAYQRAVADMKRAGLNPASIFGASRGQTAGGVGYIGSNNSGSGYSRDQDDFGVSKSAYSLLTGLFGLGAVALLKGISNPYVRFLVGTSAAKGLAGLIGVSQGK